MIDYSESKVLHLSAHVVGNGVNGEKLKLSAEPLEIENDQLQSLLLTYFLSNFTHPEYYSFTPDDSHHGSNPIFKMASQIFSSPHTLHKNSINIAGHLYETTLLPGIKSGDLFVVYLSDVRIDNVQVDALGIFKAESKDAYLKLNTSSAAFKLKSDLGVNVRKLDKGCLIFNLEKDEGFKILAVDNLNKSEAHFWMNDFLKIRARSDNYHHTRNFMNLTRQYVDDQLDEEFSVSKAEKIGLLNRSMDFFKNKDEFHQHEFEEEVLEDPSVIESFRNYERSWPGRSEADIIHNFEISAQAVKNQVRVFKSVLKLDKNFISISTETGN